MIRNGRLSRGAALLGAAWAGGGPAPELDRLKAGAQKLGQTLALVGDSLPAELRARMGSLFAEGSGRPWAEVSAGVPPGLAEVDPTPFACASLGQVHRGRLPDGRWVAVKLQYPGVAGALVADLDNLSTAALPARLIGGGAALLAGLRSSLLAELDLRREAEQACRMAEALSRWPRLRVAVPVIATETALVSPLFEGPSLHRALSEGNLVHPERTADDLVAAVFGAVFVRGIVNADAHPGNFVVLEDGLGLVDFGAVTSVSDVPQLGAGLDDLLAGRRDGALDRLGIHAGRLAPELLPLLDVLGPGPWDFGHDTLLSTLGELKRRHPMALREVPFSPGRLPLVRAAMGLHHALRRIGAPFALGEALARVRTTAAAT